MATSHKADCIANIQLSNFDEIQDFELDLSDNFYQFIVLTGDNGVGKTLLLKLILLALDVQQPIDTRTVNIRLHGHDGKLMTYSYSKTAETSLDNALFHNPYKKIAAYGASRLSIQTAESMERVQLDVQHLLSSQTSLRNWKEKKYKIE